MDVVILNDESVEEPEPFRVRFSLPSIPGIERPNVTDLETEVLIIDDDEEGSTVEPPNKGHLGTRASVHYSEVSFIRRVEMY